MRIESLSGAAAAEAAEILSTGMPGCEHRHRCHDHLLSEDAKQRNTQVPAHIHTHTI